MTPPEKPSTDINGAVRLGNEFASHRAAINVLGIIIVVILFVGIIREHGFTDAIRAHEQHAVELDSAAKSNAAKAMFWKSEAVKRAVAVTHDTLRVTKVIEGAPRYIYTDTGMRMVPLLPVEAAPPLDTTLPGHRFGAAVPYAVQPNTQFYTRASDFDSLALAAAQMHQDFEKQIAAIDSGLAHVELVATDETKRADTLQVALTAEKRAERKRIAAAALKGAAVGAAIVGVVVLLHR